MDEPRHVSAVVAFRWLAGLASFGLGACGDLESPPPPPPGKTSASPSGAGPSGAGEGDDASDSTSDATSDSTSGDGTSSTGTGASDTQPPAQPLLEGSLDGDVGLALPLFCEGRFYPPNAFDPSTGYGIIDEAFRFDAEVRAWPTAFVVLEADAQDPLVEGARGYLSFECDADGNGAFDDAVGGRYPGLLAEEITIPATDLQVTISQGS